MSSDRWDDHRPVALHTQSIVMSPGDAGPEQGGKVVGDCLRAAFASLTGLDPTEVPHFATIGLGTERGSPEWHCWWYSLVGFAASLDPPMLATEAGPDEWPTDDGWLNGCCIASGPSPRGRFLHSVVARQGEIVWDPHPSRAGLAGDITDLIVVRPLLAERDEAVARADRAEAALRGVVVANAGCVWAPACLDVYPEQPTEWCPACVALAALAGSEDTEPRP